MLEVVLSRRELGAAERGFLECGKGFLERDEVVAATLRLDNGG